MRRVLVGLIGANIQKSLSPALHEDAFAAAGMRGHYHLMDLDRLPGRSLEDILNAARTAGFAGVNVTYPCKEAVLPLLDELSEEARQIGAVNAVTFDRDGRAKGYNTDRTGFRCGFEEALGRIDGQTALLVGTGGAGRAVAFALLDLGAARVLAYDVAPERARALAAALGEHHCSVTRDPAEALAGAGGVVNATPIGMSGYPGNPVPMLAVQKHHWVADVIYTPLETDLIKGAREKGARSVGGAGMCVSQAAESFRLFSGVVPDISRMQRTFFEAVAMRERSLSEVDGAQH